MDHVTNDGNGLLTNYELQKTAYQPFEWRKSPSASTLPWIQCTTNLDIESARE